MQAVIGEFQVARFESRLLHLLGNQKALGDLQLFEFGITGQPDHFHAVLQRRRNGVQHVRRGDEKYLAQIVFHVQIMIHEHVVLFRIQHFEQRGRWIAPEVHRHLVDFIQHEHRILGSGFLHHLQHLAGQRSDVGSAMAADLGFVAHAAERKTNELAAGGLGDRHSERRFTHAGRSDKAQDGSFGVLHQAAHREEFENAFFDLLQAVMIGFQHLLRVVEVANLLGFFLPRHSQQPIQIIARHGGFGRHGRHVFQPPQLRDGLLVGVLGHARGVDLALQLVELALFAAPQFLLNRLDLLVEVILFLRLFHLALHAALDGAVDIELLDLDVQHFRHARQPVHRIEDFEQLLLFFDGQLQIRAHRVGQFARLVHADGRDHGLVVQVLAQLDVLLEQAGDARHQRFQLRRLRPL